jgi:hypothetical protein
VSCTAGVDDMRTCSARVHACMCDDAWLTSSFRNVATANVFRGCVVTLFSKLKSFVLLISRSLHTACTMAQSFLSCACGLEVLMTLR